MAKKLRLIKTSIYVKRDEFSNLEGVDFSGLQAELKNLMSKRGDGRNCVSIVRVFPTLASSNTVDVELTAFNEDINFIDETDATDQIEALIDGFIDVDFSHFVFKQTNDPLEIMGYLGI